MTKIALMAMLAMGATVANAAGTYVEVSIGSINDSSTTTPVTQLTVNSRYDTAMSIGLGYKFNDRFGLEAGYTNAGSGSTTLTSAAYSTPNWTSIPPQTGQ